MNVLTHKLKEVLYAVLPITVIVLILNFTVAPLEPVLIMRFLLGAFFIIVGLTIFLIGVDLGVTPIGNKMGHSLVKTNKLWIIAVLGFVIAFIVSVAEPDLHILAGQVDTVTEGLVSKFGLVVVVSVGIGVLLAFGLVRIIKNIPLYIILSILYGIILLLALFSPAEFIGIAFDASGATTGALSVPFILALAIGVSVLKKDSKASEKDSFGLVAIASTGAIMAVLLMSAFSGSIQITRGAETEAVHSQSVLAPFMQKLPVIGMETFIALLPLLAIFVIFQLISFKLPKKPLIKILVGLLYTFVGLVFFLVGVNAGFMEAGSVIGYTVSLLENKSIFITVAFVLGMVTILAEPAVHVLTKNIEQVTGGYIKRSAVLSALSIGIGCAVALSAVRILVPELQLWHYLLPGYGVSVLLSFFAPKLFVGIAFDSGGVASGPMTATFILAFTQGAAQAVETANVLVDGFGMIAMVALFPLITLQILGIIYKIKSRKGGLEQIGKL